MESSMVKNIESSVVDQLVVNVVTLHDQVNDIIPATANGVMQSSVAVGVLEKNTGYINRTSVKTQLITQQQNALGTNYIYSSTYE
jgi:hypothetical protein